MIAPQQIEQWIAAAIHCRHVQVSGDGHHFEAIVVSDEFLGQSRVARHQKVYRALDGRVESGAVHALSLRCLTSEEWQDG